MTIFKLFNDNNRIIALENLNLFNIGIQNEESLELLGDVISHDKSKIKSLGKIKVMLIYYVIC